MSYDLSSKTILDHSIELPDWAKLPARDPKVSRALVSTATSRSDILHQFIKPGTLIQCYAKIGHGIDSWLTRFLAILPEDIICFDLNKVIQQQDNFSMSSIIKSMVKNQCQHVILLRIDRLPLDLVHSLTQELAPYAALHTLILSSSKQPDVAFAKYRFDYDLIHLGENQLGYTYEDLEKLTSRWNLKPSKQLILQVLDTFGCWPEPCLRTLCEFSEKRQLNYPWLPGHQWLAHYILHFPLELIEIMLRVHTQPIITYEGLELFGTQQNSNTNSLLQALCDHLLVEQFSNPRLHFRWKANCIQLVLLRLFNEKHHRFQSLVPSILSTDSAPQQLCRTYLKHDYIEEIITLFRLTKDPRSLIFLLQEQPGRSIDYFRKFVLNVQQRHHYALKGSYTDLTETYALTELYYKFIDALYWSRTVNQHTPKIEHAIHDCNLISSHVPNSIHQLIHDFAKSRTAIATGHIADGLLKLEHIFLQSQEHRCFTIAAPSIALLSLVDFFCINKKHLRKILQTLNHTELFIDPATDLSIASWSSFCFAPLQIISNIGSNHTYKFMAQLPKVQIGSISEEVYFYQEWVKILGHIYKGNIQESQTHTSHALMLLSQLHRHIHELPPKTSHTAIPVLNAKELTRPWILSFVFLKLLQDLYHQTKLTSREAQYFLNQYEPYFQMTDTSQDRKDIWFMMRHIITAFLQSFISNREDHIAQLQILINESKLLGFRLLWLYGSVLLSAAFWNIEQEEKALEHFNAAISGAEYYGLLEFLTPLTELLYPQIRRTRQYNKTSLLLQKACEKIEKRQHIKNNKLEQLSKRELEILNFINQGMSNEDIAEHLCRAKGTVKLHVHNIYKKLEIRNRVEAIQLFKQYTQSV